MSKRISISELAELANKDRSVVRTKLSGLKTTDGPKNAKLYDSVEALERLYGNTELDTLETQYLVEKVRTEKARASRSELELKNAQGLYVEIERVAEVVESEYAAIKAGFLGLGARLSGELATLTSQVAIRSLIDRDVNDVLSQLSSEGVSDQAVEVQDAEESSDESETNQT